MISNLGIYSDRRWCHRLLLRPLHPSFGLVHSLNSIEKHSSFYLQSISVNNPSLGQIVGRNLNPNSITLNDANLVDLLPTRKISGYCQACRGENDKAFTLNINNLTIKVDQIITSQESLQKFFVFTATNLRLL